MYATFNRNNRNVLLENNSKGICEIVIMEMRDPIEIWKRLSSLESITPGHLVYQTFHVSDRTSEPRVRGRLLKNVIATSFYARCYVHAINGTKTETIFNKT